MNHLHPSPRRLLPALIALLLPAMAAACPVEVPEGLLDRVFDVPYTDLPDVHLASQGGAAYVALGRCIGDLNIDMTPLFAGMTYVRHINGAPAYSLSSAQGAPLVTFGLFVYAPQDDPDHEGVGISDVLRPDSASTYWMQVPGPNAQFRLRVDLYSPGGPLQGVPQSEQGAFTYTVRSNPASVLRQRVAIGVNVQGPTCTLSDTSLALDPVSADELQGSGTTAGAKPFDVLMNCPFAGTPVKLTLTDVNQPGNTTTGLLPAPGSTSGGVRVELRRGGVPITVGQQWDQGVSTAGSNRIALEARYLRTTGTLTPGDLTVQGILTADYR